MKYAAESNEQGYGSSHLTKGQVKYGVGLVNMTGGPMKYAYATVKDV